MSERWPADALVRALRGRTVIDAVCDGEGTDDVRLLLDDDTVVAIDAIAVESTEPLALTPIRLRRCLTRVRPRVSIRFVLESQDDFVCVSSPRRLTASDSSLNHPPRRFT